jgi:vibriolysin
MKAITLLLLVAAAAAVSAVTVTRDRTGAVKGLYGNLGHTLSADATFDDALKVVRALSASYGLSGEEVFVPHRSQVLSGKVRTISFLQAKNGLPVLGASITVHVTVATGEVNAVTGIVARGDAPLPKLASVDKSVAKKFAATVAEFWNDNSMVKVDGTSSLVYVIDDENNNRLAYHLPLISSHGSEGHSALSSPEIQPYDAYMDVHSGEVIMVIPKYKSALYRQVYDAQNNTTLPGVLERTEGQPLNSDNIVNEAYDGTGECYNYYWAKFQRDSYDGKGASLLSSVHYKVAYNNAFWNGQQMVYGDGDDEVFSNFASDHTVCCHELTHAVTETTSGLRYWYESGALNEAFSDIMGSTSQEFGWDSNSNSVRTNGWVIGPNCTLINLNPTGCPDCPLGLRYMDNPTLDGSSRDYYPDRYTGYADNRGVHWNSGIANLAYVLFVQGGKHPRGMTNIQVNGVGLQKAMQVFYLGFTGYMTTTSDFSDAMTATQQAARVLYSDPNVCASVTNAWLAVGVSQVSSAC